MHRAPNEHEAGILYKTGIFPGGLVSIDSSAPEASQHRSIRFGPIPADSLTEAVAIAARTLRYNADIRLLRLEHDDLVTLGIAARRSNRTAAGLGQLAKGNRRPGAFPAPEFITDTTRFYSWSKIADFLVTTGADVETTNRDAVMIDYLLRAAEDLYQAGSTIHPGVLRDLGLPVP